MTQGYETKVSNFDEFYNKYYNLDGYEHHYKEFYEAGQQSKQGEVDKLQTEIDELQKRIDEVMYDLQNIESAMWEEQVDHVLMILKGEHTK